MVEKEGLEATGRGSEAGAMVMRRGGLLSRGAGAEGGEAPVGLVGAGFGTSGAACACSPLGRPHLQVPKDAADVSMR